ncbi:MAG TPA: hypothetical protein DFI63_03320 [Lachnospiraceae bacterium]|nr:hypothetical protein [Lachnospiraceae bacterium]
MKVCKNCGTQNKDTSLFCEGCGTRLEEAPAVVTPVVEEPAATVVPPVAEPPVTEVPAHEPQVQPAFEERPADTRRPEGAFSGQTEQTGTQQNAYQQPLQQNMYQQPAQQNIYQQPAYNAVPQEPQKKNGNWMTITSLILSILSIVCCCLDVFALILAIASIVLAIIALVQHKGNKGMAIASLIVGIIGFLIAVYLLVYAYAILPNNPALQSQIMDLYDELGVTGFIW